MILVAAILAGGLAWRSQQQAKDDRRAAAVRFATAWQEDDRAAMWRALAPAARAKTPLTGPHPHPEEFVQAMVDDHRLVLRCAPRRVCGQLG